MSDLSDGLEDGGDWTAEWRADFGAVPPFASDLHEITPAGEAAYRAARRWIFEQRDDGLSAAQKELLMMVMNIAVSNRDGAVIHMGNARRHGATVMQVREALAQCVLFLGVVEFLKTGQAVWQACRDLP